MCRQEYNFSHCEIFSHLKTCFYTENHAENLLAWSLHIDLYRATSFFQPPFSVKYQASGAPGCLFYSSSCVWHGFCLYFCIEQQFFMPPLYEK